MSTTLTACPPWCVTSTEDHAEDDPGHLLHRGPNFGRLTTWRMDGDAQPYTADVSDTSDMTADELRQLAADALAAAEWLEAH